MSVRGDISGILRKAGLMHLADNVRYRIEKYRKAGVNARFTAANPDVVIPPDYMIYESFQLDYGKYYDDSRVAAAEIFSQFSNHVSLGPSSRILDWGCGPGRLIRHMGALAGDGVELYGTDYNAATIAWCKSNLPGIRFNQNSLVPALPYPDNYFDVVYGISIFTHLSEAMHRGWMAELQRVTAPSGVLYLTTQGSAFRCLLTRDELNQFDAGALVVRGNTTEGHRTFSAFQSVDYMKHLFGRFQIVEHHEPAYQGGKPRQDYWIAVKPSKDDPGSS